MKLRILASTLLASSLLLAAPAIAGPSGTFRPKPALAGHPVRPVGSAKIPKLNFTQSPAKNKPQLKPSPPNCITCQKGVAQGPNEGPSEGP